MGRRWIRWLAQESGGQTLWALTDHQGSVRDVVDDDGAVLNHIVYDSFGQVTSESDPTVDFRFGYTGRELDEETGLLQYRARYYDAAVGQFVSEDPIGFSAGDANIYRYVGNSPTNYTDPSGLRGAPLPHYRPPLVRTIPSYPPPAFSNIAPPVGYPVNRQLHYPRASDPYALTPYRPSSNLRPLPPSSPSGFVDRARELIGIREPSSSLHPLLDLHYDRAHESTMEGVFCPNPLLQRDEEDDDDDGFISIWRAPRTWLTDKS